jgi:hypothetical protein
VDPDHFAGSGNKNDDYIGVGESPWTWGPGSGPQKNDLTDVYAYSFMENEEIWLIVGACTRANNGSSHIDFEFNQQGFQKTGETSGLVVGNGADGGRTAGVDFIVSVDFTEGGNVPTASFRRWQAAGGSEFEFALVTPDTNQVLVCTNTGTVPAPPWGAVAPDGSEATEVIAYQFVEVAMNLTMLQIDPSVFCTDFSTLLFKTRSAHSFDASLKDLALYQFSIIPPPECLITFDDDSICEGEMARFCGPEGDLTYEWTGPGAFMSGDRCIDIDVAGIYDLMITDNTTGCIGGPCSHELVVNPIPACQITYDTDTICADATAEFCGPEPPPGTTYTYEWDGPEGPYPDQRCLTVSQEGLYTLTVTDDLTGCSSEVPCEQYLTVNPLPSCDIQGPAFVCSGYTAQLCGPDGDYSYTWGGPNPPYPDEACITVSETGDYTLTVIDNLTGCSNGPCGHRLDVGDPPACLISGPDAICEGDEARLCGPEGDFIYEWEGPGGDHPAESCITVTEEGTYTLTVEDLYGCVSTCQHDLIVNGNTVAGDLTDLWICTGERAEFCVEVSGTPPFSYVWAKDGDVIEGADDSCYVIESITADDVGEYCVEIQGLCGPALTRCATLTLADVSITELNDLFLCPDQDGEFCVVASGKGPFTYQWKKDGEDIPGATERCYEIEAAGEDDEGRYCVAVSGACGEPVEACGISIVGTCELFCTKTQGFYGNYGGKWMGMKTLELLESLITPGNPLVMGKAGLRSVTFADGAERCIIELLPSGGAPVRLNPSIGDLTVDPATCDVGPHLPLKNGRIRNVFLGQTITLSLNMRLDPSLSSAAVCELMIAIPALPGPDGILGTDDDIPDPDAEPRFKWISTAVLDALTASGLPQTAGGLLELANMCLAGEDTDDAAVYEISHAVSAVNELFDDCALVMACENGDVWFAGFAAGPATVNELRPADPIPAPSGGGSAALCLTVSPNVNGSSTISFTVEERSRLEVEVFDVSGRRVMRLQERMVGTGLVSLPLVIEKNGRVSSGVYFVRVRTAGAETGSSLSAVEKMVVVR